MSLICSSPKAIVYKLFKYCANLAKHGHRLDFNELLSPVSAFQVAQVVKNQPAIAGDAEDVGSAPGEDPLENSLQYSCL